MDTPNKAIVQKNKNQPTRKGFPWDGQHEILCIKYYFGFQAY